MKRITLAVIVLLSGCNADLIGVPRESCKYTDTGETRVTSWQQCMPSGSNPCATSIWHQTTEHLYDVSCKFQDWKS